MCIRGKAAGMRARPSPPAMFRPRLRRRPHHACKGAEHKEISAFLGKRLYFQVQYDILNMLLTLRQANKILSTQKKEGFIERVDIAFLCRTTFPHGRVLSQSLAKPRFKRGMWRKGGNIWPLFLIAFEKAVCR